MRESKVDAETYYEGRQLPVIGGTEKSLIIFLFNFVNNVLGRLGSRAAPDNFAVICQPDWFGA